MLKIWPTSAIAAPVEAVPRRGEPSTGPVARARRRPGRVKDGDHGEHQCEARAGAELVPMRGDKQHHAAGQQNRAEDQRHHTLPAQACGHFCLPPRRGCGRPQLRPERRPIASGLAAIQCRPWSVAARIRPQLREDAQCSRNRPQVPISRQSRAPSIISLKIHAL